MVFDQNAVGRTWADVKDDPRLEALTIEIDAFDAVTHTTWVRSEMEDWHWRRIVSIAETTPRERAEGGVSRVVSVVIDRQTVRLAQAGAQENNLRRRLVVRSGGQTGVDRAALDAAIACGLPYTGFVPKGGLCEDRPWIDLLETYPSLVEMNTTNYAARTVANVKAADATLIITRANQPLGRGTVLTVRAAQRADKPHLVIDKRSVGTVIDWLDNIDCDPLDLNVAGPRESGCIGIYDAALPFLIAVFSEHIGNDDD